MAVEQTNITQYISVKPGEIKILPKGAKIVSLIKYGDIIYTSSCSGLLDDIPVEQAQCYFMKWATARSGGTSGTTKPLYKVFLEYIDILGVRYNLHIDPENEFYRPGMGPSIDTDNVETFLKNTVPQALMNIVSLSVLPDYDQRILFTLKFKSTPSVAKTIEMNIKETPTQGSSSFRQSGLFIKPFAIDCDSEEPTEEDPS